jgi:hypothetical protein
MKNVESSLGCEGLRELRLAYIEDLLESEQRERFDAHLARCADCAKDVEEMRCWVERLAQLKDASCPEPWEVFDEVRRTAATDLDVCQHLEDCPSCREYQAAFKIPPPERGMPDELWEKIRHVNTRQTVVQARLCWSEWLAEFVHGTIAAFRMPVMAAGALAAAMLVVVFLYPAEKVRSVAGLSSVKWIERPKPVKLMGKPKPPDVQVGFESLTMVVTFAQGTQPLPETELDRIYQSLQPTPDMIRRFRIVSPILIKDAVDGKRIATDDRDGLIEGLRDALDVTLVTMVTVTGDQENYRLIAEFVDTRTGWVLRETRMTGVTGPELASRIREAALRVSRTDLGGQ